MATHPDTLAQAVELIERFEGVESNAYLDPVGIPTICAGITKYPGGRAVAMGDTCSPEVCRAHLLTLLQGSLIPKLELIPGWSRFGPTRQAALCSFGWNLGAGFYGSQGFESISKVLKEGASNPLIYQQMPQVLGLYVKAGGKTLPGLVNRRAAEADLWMEGHVPMTEFICTTDTFLKKAPIDQSYLSDLGKVAKSRNQVLSVGRVDEIPRDAHVYWTLNDGERWVVYAPHWAPVASGSPPRAKVDWSDMGCKLNEFLTVGEVLCYDSRRRPRIGSKEEDNILRIAKEFEAIRRGWGSAIGVTSGYRPEPINIQVGGVSSSRHVNGDALDIYPSNGDLEGFYKWLKQRWSGGLGDGRRKGFLHIDGRGNGRFSPGGGVAPCAIWDYA